MKLLITQPTFLPWIGYFDLIEKSDIVIFLDDVQFDKRSWQQRNKIKTSNSLQWLTLPVFSKGKRSQLINEVEIDISRNLILKIQKSIELNYKRSLFFNDYFDDFIRCFNDNLKTKNLSKFNIGLIKYFLNILNLEKKIFYSSELNISGSKIEKIINICNHFNIKNYITTLGAKDYLKDNYKQFEKNNINILFHKYVHPTYRQCFKSFLPYASIIDLIFNEGGKSLEILNIGKLESLA